MIRKKNSNARHDDNGGGVEFTEEQLNDLNKNNIAKDESQNATELKTYYGITCWFRAQYGFISPIGVNQPDIFVHFSDIITESGNFKTLVKGSKVQYQIGVNKRGDPKAINVRCLNPTKEE